MPGLTSTSRTPAAARAGAPGPTAARHAARSYFNQRKATIWGGSNEIQKNIIARAVLGL